MCKILCAAAVCGLILALLLLGVAQKQNRQLSVRDVQLAESSLPGEFSGFVIAQVSDYHGDDTCLSQILDTLSEKQPDIVLLTGDLFDPGREQKSLEFVKKALDIAPVYYVNGNHEARMENYEELEAELRSLNVQVLRNESAVIGRDGASIRIAGADDPSFSTEPDYAALCKDEEYTILLSHRPELFEDYVSAGAELVFSGHAHGGQIRLPGGSRGLFAPGQGLFPKYTEGVHTQDNTSMVISRGIGNVHFPPRLFNPPELVFVTLTVEE